jgi:hypothetical protein
MLLSNDELEVSVDGVARRQLGLLGVLARTHLGADGVQELLVRHVRVLVERLDEGLRWLVEAFRNVVEKLT